MEGQDGPGDVHDDGNEERLLEDEVGLTNLLSKVIVSLSGMWVLGIIRLVFEWKVSPCSTLATGLSL